MGNSNQSIVMAIHTMQFGRKRRIDIALAVQEQSNTIHISYKNSQMQRSDIRTLVNFPRLEKKLIKIASKIYEKVPTVVKFKSRF